jgi:hypothetical protein
MKIININFKQPFFATLLLLAFAPYTFSQNNQNVTAKRAAQLTFIYPVGTNGIDAGKYINVVSINMLAGISGGVSGAEIGGLANITLGSVNGFQAAGLVNSSLYIMKGVQVGGLANFHKGEMTGLQISGLSNVNLGKSHGCQIAGLANYNEVSAKGAQIGGLSNVLIGDAQGTQISGIANVTSNKLRGAQISLMNYARVVNGVQIGLINATDSVEKGVVIGLFSFVRHGYHRVEVEANETFYGNITIKTGLPWLYNIYTLGYKSQDGKNYWSPGVGFGSMMPVNRRMNINLDLIARQVNEDEWWTEELNLLNSLKLNISYKLAEKFEIYGGPSFNLIVSGIKDSEGNIIGESFSPSWSRTHKTHDDYQLKSYVGFDFGVRF